MPQADETVLRSNSIVDCSCLRSVIPITRRCVSQSIGGTCSYDSAFRANVGAGSAETSISTPRSPLGLCAAAGVPSFSIPMPRKQA